MLCAGQPFQKTGEPAVGADLFVYFLKQLLVQSAQLAGKSQDPVFITVDAQLLCQLDAISFPPVPNPLANVTT